MGTPLALYQAEDATIACRGRAGRLWIVVQAANMLWAVKRCRRTVVPYFCAFLYVHFMAQDRCSIRSLAP